MKKKFLCLLLPIFLLSGCAPSYRIENQAHAVSMGIDWNDEKMKVIVQVPNLGAVSKKEGGEENSNYQIYSAEAENFESAYNILESSLPQQLNLTHLKTVVFSEKFARSDEFMKTIETFMNVFLVTGSANVVVTKKDAELLIENQKPHIGIRLSITIPSMLSYHAEHGYIPICTLSSLYAGLKGRYSTALCALSSTSYKNDEKENPFMPGAVPREGENKNEYMGAAVFNRNKMVGELNGKEMQMVYFLMGKSNRIADFASPIPMRVSTRKKRDIQIMITDRQVKVKVTMYLDAATLDGKTNIREIEEYLNNEFDSVIQKCKAMGVEPFGFAKEAAKKFRDNQSFEDFDWLARFRDAHVEVVLKLISEK